MSRRSATLGALLLGVNNRQRVRVSQSLLAVPALPDAAMKTQFAASWRGS
jgi:hypothetical protein